MADCKLNELATTFSRQRIILHVELVPLEGQEFDLTLEEVGKKLSSVANYAASTFNVSAVPAGAATSGPNRSDLAAKQDARNKKMMKTGHDRAVKVFQDEIGRAKAAGDAKGVKLAEENLERAESKIKRDVEQSAE